MGDPVPEMRHVRTFANPYLLQTGAGALHQVKQADARTHQHRHQVNVNLIHPAPRQVLGGGVRAAPDPDVQVAGSLPGLSGRVLDAVGDECERRTPPSAPAVAGDSA